MAGRRWTDEEAQQVLSMCATGCTAKAIAKELKRSPASVQNYITRNNIKRDAGEEAAVSERLHVEENGNKQDIIWTTSTPVRTADDALKKAEINKNIWEIDKSVINSYEAAAKKRQRPVS